MSSKLRKCMTVGKIHPHVPVLEKNFSRPTAVTNLNDRAEMTATHYPTLRSSPLYLQPLLLPAGRIRGLEKPTHSLAEHTSHFGISDLSRTGSALLKRVTSCKISSYPLLVLETRQTFQPVVVHPTRFYVYHLDPQAAMDRFLFTPIARSADKIIPM